MTPLLEQTYRQVAQLPDAEQDAIAALIQDELTSEERWQQAFSGSAEKLAQLAQEALAEHRSGKTLPLDPDAV